MWLAVLPLGLVWCGLGLSTPLSHDEQMYVSAGVLALDRMPYADFAYLQAPYLPYLYALLFGPSAGSFALLKARLLSVVATGVAAACIYLVACRATRSPSIALLGTIWFATHHLTLFALPLARNLGVAMAFSLAGLALLCLLYTSPSPRDS